MQVIAINPLFLRENRRSATDLPLSIISIHVKVNLVGED